MRLVAATLQDTDVLLRRVDHPGWIAAVGYSAQAGCYFAALRRLDACMLTLLLYTFPAMVTVAAIALGRERANRRTTGALTLASAGLCLVLAGAGSGALDPLGTVLRVSAAVIYSTYVLTSAGIAERVAPLILSALVCTRRRDDADAGHAAGGDLDPGDVSAAGFGWLAGVAVVSPVVLSACSSPAEARRRDERLDPLDRRSAGHRPPRVPGLRRVARSGPARRRGARRVRCSR